MSFSDALITALQSLRANLLRSLLTMLGIIIGVASVVLMISIGQGAQSQITNYIKGLGSNLIIITPGSSRIRGASGGAGTRPTLTLKDADAIREEVPNLHSVSPSVEGTGQIISRYDNWNTFITGSNASVFEARNWKIGEGRLFTDTEGRSSIKYVVLGKTVANNLFPYGQAVGQTVRIDRVPFEVIGVLAEKGQSSFGRDQDDVVYMPFLTAKRRIFGKYNLGGDTVSSISISVADAVHIAPSEQAIREILRRRHKLRKDDEDDFRIHNLAQILEASKQTTEVMTILLAAIASVSLLVGGIGIMNIMLVSVTERTKEIGLRMAVGARPRDVQSQFLIESVAMSLAGGALGIVVGAAGAQIAAHFGKWPYTVSLASIALAVGFSAAIGVFFGFYPALRAARLNPIVALRSE